MLAQLDESTFRMMGVAWPRRDLLSAWQRLLVARLAIEASHIREVHLACVINTWLQLRAPSARVVAKYSGELLSPQAARQA